MTVEIDLSPLLPRVRADPRHAREALSMLLNRVAARSSPGGHVRLAADTREEFVALEIRHDSLLAGESFPLAQRLLQLGGGALAARGDGELDILPPADRAGM